MIHLQPFLCSCSSHRLFHGCRLLNPLHSPQTQGFPRFRPSLHRPTATIMSASLVSGDIKPPQHDSPEHDSSSSSAPQHSGAFMLVSDLDCTLVDNGDPSHSALLNFNCLWAAEYAHNSSLVYSTGRTMERYSELLKEAPLLTPEVLILSVGTEIRWGSSLEVDKEWVKEIEDGWDRDIVVEEALKFPHLQFQEETDQGPHKVSFKVDKDDQPDICEKLSSNLVQRGLKVRLLYSSGIDLDVLPYKAGKGQALAYVLRKLGSSADVNRRVLVCGDSGNDIDLFHVDDVYGVIVSNAQAELLDWYKSHERVNVIHASQRCGGAIIEGLKHFEFGPHLSPLDRINENYVPILSNKMHYGPSAGPLYKEVVEFNVFMVKWLRGQVPNTEESFQRLQGVIGDDARVVYPWGIESSLVESIRGLREKYGSMPDSDFQIWFDVIKHEKLADGVYLVTWQPWERRAGDKRGYFATAILIGKESTPNGLEWRHFHETSRKIN